MSILWKKEKQKMILAQSIENPVQASGIQASGTFGVKAENLSWLFQILRNNLYSDKPLAVIREYFANATDAHVAAGTPNRPVAVTMPTDMEPTLVIRDFGFGLDQEGIFNVFASYGASTKRDSNDAIGGFGIGSKSAFCYVQSFTIISYFNGTMSMYHAYIDETNIGKVDLVGKPTPTEEENGIEIRIEVKTEDISTFVSTARKLFRHVEVKPIIRGNHELAKYLDEYQDGEVFLSGTDWTITHSQYGRREAFCIMGGLRYPLQIDKLSEECYLWFNSLNSKEFFIKCPIGSIKVSSSREALDYEVDTIKYLTQAVLKAKAEVTKTISDKLENCKTLWEARILTKTLRGSFGNIRIDFLWQGQKIDQFNVSKEVMLLAYNTRERSMRTNGKESWLKLESLESSKGTVIFVDSGEVKRNSVFARIRQEIASKGYSGNKCVLMNFLDKSRMDSFVNNPEIVGAKVIDISTIDYTPPKRASRKGALTDGSKRKVDVFAYNGRSYAYPKSEAWNHEAIDLEDGEGVYVTIKSFLPFNELAYSFSTLQEATGLISQLSGEEVKVYGFREKTKNIGAGWKTLDERAKEVVQTVFKNKLFRQVIVRFNLNSRIQKMYTDMASRQFEGGQGSLKKLLDAISALPQPSSADADSYVALEKLCRKLGISVDEEIESELGDFAEMQNQVTVDYPLIDAFNYFRGDWNHFDDKISDYVALMDKQ
jgi:hypothetical protein